MTFETEILETANGFIARASYGFAMKQKRFPTREAAQAAAPVIARELESAMRQAQSI